MTRASLVQVLSGEQLVANVSFSTTACLKHCALHLHNGIILYNIIPSIYTAPLLHSYEATVTSIVCCALIKSK